jgi:hypothetical protein
MDNRTGDVVKVIDSFENIAILENKTKVDVRRLLNSEYYTEYIDPKKFIDNTSSNIHNSIFESIKSIPTNNIRFEETEGEIRVTPVDNMTPVNNKFDEPVVYTSTIEDEKAELAKKYGVSIENTLEQSRQNEAFTKLLGEEAANELPVVRTYTPNEDVQRVEVIREESTGKILNKEIIQNNEIKKDPWEMFRGIKRGIEFKLDLPLTNKIPKLEFIEMMEESYDKSIIEFLAHDITQEILKNPDTLRNSIETKIREMVYGEVTKTKPTTKKPPSKRPTKPSTTVGENSTIRKTSGTKTRQRKKPITDDQ